VTVIQRRGGPQVEALQDRFGVRGAAEDTELIDAVLPVAVVPRLDNLCGGGAALAGVASERSMIQLFNPVGSGITIILHRFWYALATAGTFSIRMHNTALTTLATEIDVLNRTLGNQPEPSGQVRTLAGTGVGTVSLQMRVTPANLSIPYELGRPGEDYKWAGLSLAEGRGVNLVPSVDNITATAAFLWSERITEV